MPPAASFDPSKAYAQQEEVYFNDGREAQLLDHVQSRPDIDKLRGSPQKVLAAIDEFGRQEKYLMNIGEDKGAIVTKVIRETQPKIMVELGGYVGYSAILFGDAARAAGAQAYICLERSAEFAGVARALIDLAGLASFVEIVVGPSSDSLRALHASGRLKERIDVLFLDHYKPAYLPDLQLCEQLGFVGRGAVIVADNVIKPGNPPYLAYVRSSVESKKRAAAAAAVADGDDDDGGGGAVRGNPELVYESELVQSFEPTGIPDGVEITICLG
ncbi:catechol O-methyltransferase [Beauveria brongniartii RCEF 3172]|uniref:catechol O-methyltransferase n=1 Tax=Beauveria brongniartii RCEF 3172 TaxID=1081107 RepID=A0A167FVL5_9HYPO|nr:catechol O-methyltransferase [Beauveria brongniartii RCEF 3172]